MEIRDFIQGSLTDHDAAELARVRTAVDPGRLRTDPPVSAELAHNSLLPSVSTYSFKYFGLFDADRLVGYGESSGAINAENVDVCEIGIFVDAQDSDHALHKQLFDHIHAVESDRGRTRFWGWGDLKNAATRSFWENHLGYELAYDERMSRCDWYLVNSALMHSWLDRAHERAADYHLIRASAPMDDTNLGFYAQGLEAMNDAPVDDLVFDAETFDLDRARQMETLHVARKSTYHVIFAVETATDELAGYTAIRIPETEPSFAKQGDTVTVAAHRNRGIGRWLKADMWTWLRETRPEVRFVDTGNAESNRAMLAINEAMGFRDILHHGVWHKPA